MHLNAHIIGHFHALRDQSMSNADICGESWQSQPSALLEIFIWYVHVAAMQIKFGDTTNEPPARFRVGDFRDGKKRKSLTAARFLIQSFLLHRLFQFSEIPFDGINLFCSRGSV
jgi:hypothetical protein